MPDMKEFKNQTDNLKYSNASPLRITQVLLPVVVSIVLSICISVNCHASSKGKINPNSLFRIEINTATQQLAVFYNNEMAKKPIYVFPCSTGIYDNTFTGTFSTSDYYDWRSVMGGVWARYAVRFNGNELIHSVPYYRHSPDSLEYEEYNKLGERASLGCCRLCVRDAKWIYENTKPGTQVDVIDDANIKYPLTYPQIFINCNDKIKRSWDPTDPDSASPWNSR